MAHGYGVTLTEADRASVHIRPVEQMLAQVLARDDRPLHVTRPPAARLPVNCRHFTVLMTAMLRAHGTPARARCGFGGYFGTGKFEDHWVCEYWHAAREGWVLVDAQVDDRQRDWFGIDFDVTDVPRDRFLTAGRAWARCRSGAADPAMFGLSSRRGGRLVDRRQPDARRRRAPQPRTAALGLLGRDAGTEDTISDELARLFDRLAALTEHPDARLRGTGPALRGRRAPAGPAAVRNAARDRDELLYPDR